MCTFEESVQKIRREQYEEKNSVMYSGIDDGCFPIGRLRFRCRKCEFQCETGSGGRRGSGR
ncbi:hypothetical protein IMSAG025_01935 [Muribaculaceae bacterium]|nr:hypothetical protein IMSAG025_01935 [Muribaculaceae bacterium]